MLSTRSLIDVVFVALVVIAVTITTLVLVKVVTDDYSGIRLDTQSRESASDQFDEEKTSKQQPTIEDPDNNLDPEFVPDLIVVESSNSELVDHPIVNALYHSSLVILPITWGAVVGALIWKGRIRSQWSKEGYDYDIFKLVARMRGSSTRIKLLNVIINEEKNKLQIAKEIGIDWKTVDNHVKMLMQSRLIEEKLVGASRYYTITSSGRKILTLLSNGETVDQ